MFIKPQNVLNRPRVRLRAIAANVSSSPVAAAGSSVLLASEHARLGTETDIGLVTTTGHTPGGFCDDELASLSRLHSLAANLILINQHH